MNEDESSRGRGKSLDTDLPNTTIENIKELIEAYFRLRAADNSISTKEVSKVVSFGYHTASKQGRFLISTEILKKDGRKYRLTEKGAKYAKYLSWNQNDRANQILKELMLNSETVDQFVNFLKIGNKKITRNEAIDQIAMLGNVPPDRSDLITGSETVLDLLIESGLLKEYNDGDYITYNQTIEENNDKKEDDIELSKRDVKETETSLTLEDLITTKKVTKSFPKLDVPTELILSLNINFEITSDMKPNWIKDVIASIVSGLEESHEKIDQKENDVK